MLYQPRTRTRLFERAMAFIAAIAGSLARSHADTAYLDGMRPEELEDLGLRRHQGGGYRFFL